jgi:hypothetical protein
LTKNFWSSAKCDENCRLRHLSFTHSKQNESLKSEKVSYSYLKSRGKGPITWSIFNPGVELSPVYRVEISALSVIQNSIKIKRAITGQNFQPRAEIIMSYSSIRDSDYLLQENKIKAFLLPGIVAENV